MDSLRTFFFGFSGKNLAEIGLKHCRYIASPQFWFGKIEVYG
jgi:hypothetical protein